MVDPAVPLIDTPGFAHLVKQGVFGPWQSVAEQLHSQGYVVLDLGRDRMASFSRRIRRDLESQFDVDHWRAMQSANGLRLQDAWQQSFAVRQLALLPELQKMLRACWGRSPFAFQTLNFPVGTQQHLHSDAVHFHSEPAGFMCGVWVALEDVDSEAGPLEYVPRSQRLPYLQACDVGVRQHSGVVPDQTIFHQRWDRLIQDELLQVQQFCPRVGQVLVWTANLLHGGSEVLNHDLTRWSQVTHYFFEGCRYYTPMLSDWPEGPVAWRQPFNLARHPLDWQPKLVEALQKKEISLAERLLPSWLELLHNNSTEQWSEVAQQLHRAGVIPDLMLLLQKQPQLLSEPALSALDSLSSEEHLYLSASDAVEKELWFEAEKLLQRFLKQHPDHASAHHLFGRCLRQRGDDDQALQEQQRSCDLDPSMGWNWFAAGELLMKQQRWKQAAASFSQALHALPSEGWISSQLQQAQTALALEGEGLTTGLGLRTYQYWIDQHEPSLLDPLVPFQQPFWLLDGAKRWHALHGAGAQLIPRSAPLGLSPWPQDGWFVLLGEGSLLRSGALQTIEGWLQYGLPWQRPQQVVADVSCRPRGGWSLPDLIYADEDLIDAHNQRFDPWFKPGWVPESFWSSPWLDGLSIWRLSWLRHHQLPLPPGDAVGRFRWQLQALEHHPVIEHCPLILLHQRVQSVETSHSDPVTFSDKASSLEQHLQHLGEGPVQVLPSIQQQGCFRLQWARPRAVTCSLLIPTRDRADLLEVCLNSVWESTSSERSSGIDLELVVVDNGSVESATATLLHQWSEKLDQRFCVISADQPFNWSHLNNIAAARSKGELLLCLNNDIEAHLSGWLEAMVVHASRAAVGCVGANLLYPDGRLQHSGVVLGFHSGADHAYRGLPLDHAVHRGRSRLLSGWGAITGACMMLRRELLERCGGFDEGLPVEFNDVDLCLRLQSLGYRHVIPPDAVLTHHESQSRDAKASATADAALKRMQRRWPGRFKTGSPWWPQQCEINQIDGRPLGLMNVLDC